MMPISSHLDKCRTKDVFCIKFESSKFISIVFDSNLLSLYWIVYWEQWEHLYVNSALLLARLCYFKIGSLLYVEIRKPIWSVYFDTVVFVNRSRIFLHSILWYKCHCNILVECSYIPVIFLPFFIPVGLIKNWKFVIITGLNFIIIIQN